MSQTAVDPSDDESNKSGVMNTLQTVWKMKGLIPPAIATTVQYYTWGPPLYSWSLGSHLFTAIVKANGGIREKPDPSKPVEPAKVMQASRKRLAFIEAKDPKNGVCSEIQIPVKRLELKGVLAELDAAEDGSRKLSAEWQIHDDVVRSSSSRVLLYVHGGAYTVLNPKTHRPMTLAMSKSLNCRVLSVDYRLSPETVFPGALQDAVTAYMYLTQDLGIAPDTIIVSGDSAGGNLALALTLYLRDNEMKAPGGAILISPWVDMTASLKSWEDNAAYDYLSMPPADHPLAPSRCFLGERYDELLTSPYVTSMLADLSNLPPLLIQAGGAETLRDESTLLALRADAAGGTDVTHEIWDHGFHVMQGFVKTDMAVAAFEAMKRWIEKQKTPSSSSSSSSNDNEGGGGKFAHVDRLLDEALEARRSRAEARAAKDGKKQQQQQQTEGNKAAAAVVVEPKFIFEAVERVAPAVRVRAGATNEIVKKAVEEAKGLKQRPGLTTIYVPKRNPATLGLIGKVRGTLHL